MFFGSYHVISWVLGVFLCVWVVFCTFNSRSLHSCSLISYTLPLLSLAFCVLLFLGISCCFLFLNTLCLCHFDFWISISFVKVMFLPKSYQFYVVLLLMYRPGHRSWWRAWHVTVWGMLSRTRGQVRKEWFRSEHSRRFMELVFCSEHGRLSLGLRVIDVLDNGRSGGLTSSRGAHRRISQ